MTGVGVAVASWQSRLPTLIVFFFFFQKNGTVATEDMTRQTQRRVC